ncbi:3' terminal RNA ribose 2'-O-methyltransferase Hen1 [Paenibacillus sp. CMAA1739]|uniref:3' terminal RNA ribose 2'-O-methyltransferase Hen1 n=1 Tax=Paenibacillus ottowii TaxID=2315729 RepID=UPI00272FB6AB|nr:MULTISPECIES: 3' terminal RNA ribose 2'-O-methyltransferase Hen1 [Paenibacillus]MDP1510031.1 3' terminal RNA ribose 2'-O-methyltransferase Hen1 [Paenibacillus ottowii]MEC4567998.1 3' terminal RNA ribose 2'-O-methyltransferase Hen1 [Paenibacillus sp. CMAA1739]
MHITLKATGTNAGMISHLLAKNPNNTYDRTEKGARVRMVYTVFTEEEAEIVIQASPDSIDLVKNSPDSYDITQYINDREFVTSSLFCTYIRGALGTALNGKPKENYAAWVAHRFALELSFGPVASDLPDAVVEGLFAPLGYQVTIERGKADYAFQLKNRSTVRYVTLSGQQTVQYALRQLLLLIPVLDNYKHYYISEEELDKLKRYGEGWLSAHPLRELIIRRTLHFTNLIEQFEQLEAAETTSEKQAIQERNNSHEQVQQQEQSLEAEKQQPAVRLNELRYQAIMDVIRKLPRRQKIVDFGSGEGKLSARLARMKGIEEIWAVEPSAYAQVRAIERFAKLERHADAISPIPMTGSLFYYDEQLWGKDVMILCEVIEHVDEHRLNRVMNTIVTEYQPGVLIVTTPNREYNEVYRMDQQELRHSDHRFEWSRNEFRERCEQWIEEAPYSLALEGIGEEVEGFGQPTQMAVFTRTKELKEA